jgi:hypothetical protein
MGRRAEGGRDAESTVKMGPELVKIRLLAGFL